MPGWTPIGRLPVAVPLEALDEEALVRILKEPKNALTKQYHKLFDLESVKISFEESALRAVAQKALKRGTGARGLRAILEEALTDVMFDLPTREDEVEVKVSFPETYGAAHLAGKDAVFDATVKAEELTDTCIRLSVSPERSMRSVWCSSGPRVSSSRAPSMSSAVQLLSIVRVPESAGSRPGENSNCPCGWRMSR